MRRRTWCRRAIHDRVGLKRQVLLDIPAPPTTFEHDLAVVNDRHGQALDIGLGHHPFRFTVDVFGGDRLATEAADHGFGVSRASTNTMQAAIIELFMDRVLPLR